MYGFINTCLRTLVVEKFGEETWNKLRVEAGVQDTFLTYEVYGDDITMNLVTEACRLLEVKPEVVLKLFGEYFFDFCKRSGYDHMLRTLGGNLFEFIENLDALHSYLALSYKEMKAPSFRVERNHDSTMLLHYYSIRRGLCHIVPGIIGAVAKDFFNSEITMEIVSQLEELETGKKEHVVFLVTQRPATVAGSSPAPHTVTARSLQRRVSRHDVLACSTEPLPPKTASLCNRNHWGTIRGLVHLGKGKLLRGFVPEYPENLSIDLKTFCNVFPFHIVFDEQLMVRQAGVNLQRIVPGLQTRSITLDQYFTIVQPEVTFTISSIRKFINSHFVLQTCRDMMPEAWRSRPMLQLRGQMVWMSSLGCMLYQASPLLRSLRELEERHMHIADIAPHDATRDLILLNQQRLAEMELSNQLERKKEELRLLSQHLEAERRKTETLLYAMLPRHVANLLKEGKAVEAGEFKECTILFSDVVTFTNICAQCEPIHIVFMLNSMYLRFDRLTTVHKVYKVETIGDAYMVVGGVPIPVSSHAERVANFSLGMILAAREVINPVTGGPIQIRVGLHSGPVLAGVVGEKMPRYCLFGDTVNTASRMESHGLPDKIHLSPSVYQALKGKGYDMQERGEMEVKGKGKMTTYFLERNLRASEQQIMGLSGVEEDASSDQSHQPSHQDASDQSHQPSHQDASDQSYQPSHQDASDQSHQPSHQDASDQSHQPSHQDASDQSHQPSHQGQEDASDQSHQPSHQGQEDASDQSHQPSHQGQEDASDQSHQPSHQGQEDASDQSHQPSHQDASDQSHQPSHQGQEDASDQSHQPSHQGQEDASDQSHQPSHQDASDQSHQPSHQDASDQSHQPSHHDASDQSHQPSHQGQEFTAVEEQHKTDLCPVPMRYGDSVSEASPSPRDFDRHPCSTFKPRDSESYGSLHTASSLSEDRAPYQLEDTDHETQARQHLSRSESADEKQQSDRTDDDRPLDSEDEHIVTASTERDSSTRRNKHTRTRLCVVL